MSHIPPTMALMVHPNSVYITDRKDPHNVNMIGLGQQPTELHKKNQQLQLVILQLFQLIPLLHILVPCLQYQRLHLGIFLLKLKQLFQLPVLTYLCDMEILLQLLLALPSPLLLSLSKPIQLWALSMK